ncbi:hypothetical protein D9M72_432380 [compost metagenome]
MQNAQGGSAGAVTAGCIKAQCSFVAALDDNTLLGKQLNFDLKRCDAVPPLINLGRRRMKRHGHACTRGVQQADRLVGQLACGNVAM